MRLEIECCSPLMLGSGSGRGSFIDSDIVFDKDGIPIFPARRLKGLLRESALEVIEMLEQAGLREFFSPHVVEQVFGSTRNRSAIRVNNLYLRDYQQILEGLHYVQQEFPSIVNKDAVMNALTDIRQQTAMENGVAREHSLRTIRVLNPEYQFEGRIELLNMEGSEETETLLALAGLNLKRAGSGRNRGWGEISCRLYSDDGENLGDKHIGLLKQWDKNNSPKPSARGEINDSQPSIEELPPTPDFTYTHKLEYVITTASPLLFTAPEGDENMVASLDYIPGTALQGYFANRLIRQKKLVPAVAQTDVNFKEWFLDGALCFSNAYLMYTEADYGKYPLYPTPMFLHTDKEKDEVYNLIEDKPEDSEAIGGYCCLINGEIQNKEPEKAINFHLVRNSSSGKARERVEGHGDDGGIFHYETLNEGQNFHGYISGSQEYLQAFLDLFSIEPGESTIEIYLGRSLSTQYGLVQIEFNNIIENEPSTDDTLLGEDTDNYLVTRQVVLYLLSPLVLNNEQGFPAICERELLAALKGRLGVEEITIEKSFARVETRSAFVSHWKMHEPSFRCWAAGSGFLLQLGQDIEQELKDKLQLLMQEGLGEKRHQGYGQIRFIGHEIKGFYDKQEARSNYNKPDELSLWVCKILEQIKEERLERMVIATAAQRARQYYDGNSAVTLSSNLLGRLELIVKASVDQKDLSQKIGKLRETARKPLENMKLGEQTLYDNLTATNLEVWCQTVVKKQWQSFAEFTKFLSKFRNKGKDLEASLNDEKLYKIYWQVFFRTLRKLYKLSPGQEGREAHA